MEQSRHEQVVIMNEINRQNAIYEDHIAALFITLNVTQFNFPYRSGSFKYGNIHMDSKGHHGVHVSQLYDVESGSDFKTWYNIHQPIDFCKKLWMKYISPGVPFQIWDLDQQYIMFPYNVVKEYKETTN